MTGENQDPGWLADPNQPRPAESPAPAPPAEEPEPETLGAPRQVAEATVAVSEKESLLRRALEQYEEEALADPGLEEAVGGFSLAGFFKRLGLTSLVIGLSALALLVLATQALSYVSYLSSLPEWARITGYALGGLLVLIAVGALIRFLFSYYRFQASPRVSLQALSALNARAHLRRQASGLLQQARDRLRDILREYPLEGEKERRRLIGLGFDPDTIDLLIRNRAQLLEAAEEESHEGWLAQFDARFLVFLDQAARRRIKRHAWLVGVKTAAAPTGLVDASIVLINAYRLMDELCQIYRLRAGGMGTASILFRIFVNAFAAARLEEWMDNASQQIVDAAAQGSDGMAAFFKVISGGVFSRLAEGGANAFLLVRLGVAGMHYLRPMAAKPTE